MREHRFARDSERMRARHLAALVFYNIRERRALRDLTHPLQLPEMAAWTSAMDIGSAAGARLMLQALRESTGSQYPMLITRVSILKETCS